MAKQTYVYVTCPNCSGRKTINTQVVVDGVVEAQEVNCSVCAGTGWVKGGLLVEVDE